MGYVWDCEIFEIFTSHVSYSYSSLLSSFTFPSSLSTRSFPNSSSPPFPSPLNCDRYEDSCRQLLGNKSYTLFGLDKVIQQGGVFADVASPVIIELEASKMLRLLCVQNTWMIRITVSSDPECLHCEDVGCKDRPDRSAGTTSTATTTARASGRNPERGSPT